MRGQAQVMDNKEMGHRSSGSGLRDVWGKQVLPQSRRELCSEEKGSPERLDCGASSHIPQPDAGQIRVA